MKFTINLAEAVESEVIDPVELATYLRGKIKIEGKTENLEAGGVKVEPTEKAVSVSAKKGGVSKRSLKYLTRRFLHSIKMRDYLRIVADGKNSYAVKIVKVGGAEESDGEEED